MRNTFIKTLERLAADKPDLFFLTADLGYKIFDGFKASFSKRFINAGVAESNMVSVAAGLAAMNKHPFVYSIGPFMTLRPLEQIRNDICYHNLPVVITAVGGGFSYGYNGPSHHIIEDISVMRVLPNMTVICPCDPIEVEHLLPLAYELKKPVYFRLGRGGEKIIHNSPLGFAIGEGVIIKEGKDCTIMVTGGIAVNVIEAADILKRSGISCRVVLMPTVKPIDKELIYKCSRETGAIFTVEEHLLNGGFGSAVAEVLSEKNIKVTFQRFGVDDKFIHMSGSQEYLKGISGIDTESICSKIKNILKEEKL